MIFEEQTLLNGKIISGKIDANTFTLVSLKRAKTTQPLIPMNEELSKERLDLLINELVQVRSRMDTMAFQSLGVKGKE